MRALVVGQGSIGQRHRRLLEEVGVSVRTVSTHAEGAYRSIALVDDLPAFDYAVIADATIHHAASAAQLVSCGFVGRLLIEKPLYMARTTLDLSPCRSIHVGYNLRLHPVVKALRSALAFRTVSAVRMHVGQFLPDWRPGRDYRSTSSAHAATGGGVLRDLSHELDMMGFLFGPWRRLIAARPQIGLLGIAVDESWSLIVEMATGALITLTLNYHDRPAERRYVVSTDQGTINADLIAGIVAADGRSQQLASDRDQTYREMHSAILSDRFDDVAGLQDGLAVLDLIAAAEASALAESWQKNG